MASSIESVIPTYFLFYCITEAQRGLDRLEKIIRGVDPNSNVAGDEIAEDSPSSPGASPDYSY